MLLPQQVFIVQSTMFQGKGAKVRVVTGIVVFNGIRPGFKVVHVTLQSDATDFEADQFASHFHNGGQGGDRKGIPYHRPFVLDHEKTVNIIGIGRTGSSSGFCGFRSGITAGTTGMSIMARAFSHQGKSTTVGQVAKTGQNGIDIIVFGIDGIPVVLSVTDSSCVGLLFLLLYLPVLLLSCSGGAGPSRFPSRKERRLMSLLLMDHRFWL